MWSISPAKSRFGGKTEIKFHSVFLTKVFFFNVPIVDGVEKDDTCAPAAGAFQEPWSERANLVKMANMHITIPIY